MLAVIVEKILPVVCNGLIINKKKINIAILFDFFILLIFFNMKYNVEININNPIIPNDVAISK